MMMESLCMNRERERLYDDGKSEVVLCACVHGCRHVECVYKQRNRDERETDRLCRDRETK
jgi:hypothetical protein